MEIEEITRKSFDILDGMKQRLNELIMDGVTNINASKEKSMVDLRNAANGLNLTAITGALDDFLSLLRRFRGKEIKNKVFKKESTEVILNMVLMNRLFERIMSIELAKKKLLQGVGETSGRSAT